MKKLITFFSLICVVTLAITAFAVFATAADGPTVKEGDVSGAEAIADAFFAESTDSGKLSKAKELNVYLFARPISIVKAQADLGADVYAAFEAKVEKIMAWGAVSVLNQYNDEAHTYECRTVINWASRFMEYDIADYTVSAPLSADFFTATATADATEKTIGQLYVELSTQLEAKLAEAKDELSLSVFDEYIEPTIMRAPGFTPTDSIVTNPNNVTFHGVVYENGYKRGDDLPKFNYNLGKGGFESTDDGSGAYDALISGSYVIFAEGVTDYYIGGANGATKSGTVLRNYVYDKIAEAYVKVEDGKGVYDFVEANGFGQLLKPDPYYIIDMTDKTVESSVPYSAWGFGTHDSSIVQVDLSYFDLHGYATFSVYYSNTLSTSDKGGVALTLSDGNLKFAYDVYSPDGKNLGKVNLADIIVPGRWTNVAFVMYGPYITVYVDYELIGTMTTKVEGIKSARMIRARVYGKDDLGFAFDNFAMYEGTAPRDVNMLDNMSVDEKFVLFSKIINNDDYTTVGKKYAYAYMESVIGNYFAANPGFDGDHVDQSGNIVGGTLLNTNADIKAALVEYFSFDFDILRADNTKQYALLVDELAAVDRLYSTIGERTDKRDAITKFVGENDLLTSGSEYESTKALFDELCAKLNNDVISYKFVVLMDQYDSLSAYTKKHNKYLEAVAYIDGLEFDETITQAGETALEAAIEKFENAEAELYELLCVFNSESLIMYVDYTRDYPDEAAWEANYNRLLYPLDKAKAIIRSGDYDPNFSGVSEAIAWYNVINAYFNGKLQVEYIAYLTAFKEKFTSTDAYLEKLGLCAQLDKYKQTAEFDMSNTELAALLAEVDSLIDGLDELEDDYIAERYLNAERFVEIVGQLDGAEDYDALMELLATAEGYYFSMITADTDNLTEAQIIAAKEKYKERIAYAERIYEASSEFKFCVSQILVTTELSERYKLIVRAYSCLENVSEDIDGVTEALASYNAAYADYMAATSGVNNEITQTQSAAASLCAKWSAADVIKTFAELVGILFN